MKTSEASGTKQKSKLIRVQKIDTIREGEKWPGHLRG